MIAIFIVPFAVVIAACALFSYWRTYTNELGQSRNYGRSGVHLAEAPVSGAWLDALSDPTEELNEVND